ncbi:clotting factor B-like [Argiope bruennichi]|uniref:clotting factor B-like n=1 Tax=Argiope bruennichi TaxID=94029 RepID=UPI0024952217|nr:clotting factor B-like [Argiope bruennichi]
MKCISCLGKILTLLLSLYLVDVSFAQRGNRHARQSHNDRNCPDSTKCVEFSRCRPGLLRHLGHPPINCGFTYHGKQRVCCPERSSSSPRTARPTASRPITQEVLVTASIGPRNGQQERDHLRLSHQDCPNGTKCVEFSRCPPARLRDLEHPPKNCGFTYHGKQRVCCPEKRPSPPPFTSRSTPSGSVTQEASIETFTTPKNGQQECGKVSALQGLETAMKTERQGAWPWMVAIFMRDRYGLFEHKCSASMITRRHVLSAAHCFKRRDPSLYVAKIGHVDRNLGYRYGIHRIYVPDTYRRDQFYDDIAVLTLSRDVWLENVSPICLPLSSEFINLAGREATAVGWGSTESDGPSSDLLRKLHAIPIISNWECDALLNDRVLGFRLQFPRGITDGFICAGFLEGGKDTCGGDSGGPLMDLQDDRWYVVGVVSFGVECAKPGFPGGYTRVSKYLKWIQQRIRTGLPRKL